MHIHICTHMHMHTHTTQTHKHTQTTHQSLKEFDKPRQFDINVWPDVWFERGLHERDTALGEDLTRGGQGSRGGLRLGVTHLRGREGRREGRGGREGGD